MSAQAEPDLLLHPIGVASMDGFAQTIRQMGTRMGNDVFDEDRATPRPERRRYQRHALPCECWLENDELTIFGPTIDVGMGGLFVRTAIPVDTGTIVSVTLKFQSELKPIEAQAVVTRTVPAHAGLRYGVGVEFLEVELGVHALLGLLQRSAPLAW